MKGPKKPDPVDVEVGQRIRIQRLQSGLSQTALAEQLGVTFQQVQKYEKGVNRVGAGRLTKIAEVLAVPVSTLFGVHDAGVLEYRDRRTASSPLKLLGFGRTAAVAGVCPAPRRQNAPFHCRVGREYCRRSAIADLKPASSESQPEPILGLRGLGLTQSVI